MANTTNNYGLPAPLYKALIPDRRQKVLGRIGATDLIDAPLRRILQMKYFSDMQEDASENLWSLLGKAIHYVVEQSGHVDTSELKEEWKHESGATLVTIGDYYDNKVLTDWKITSVWSFLLGTKEEWINQLNVVRYIYGKVGIPVEKMQVYAILRDHMKTKIYDAGYPQVAFQQIDIPMLPEDKLEEYVTERVRLHLEAEKCLEDISKIPQCSPKERWQRETTYAVKKKDQKKAVRVFPTEQEAADYISNTLKRDGLSIETRIGADIKCATYCNVNSFCPYFKKSDVGILEE
jgi:hypothetical protein